VWVGDQKWAQRAQTHRGVRRFGHRVDTEHVLRRVNFSSRPGWAPAPPRSYSGISAGVAVAYRDRIVFQLRHSLASPVMRRASQM